MIKLNIILMMQDYLKLLGKNIRNERLSKSFSQEQLAEMIGKTRNYIGMVERAELNTSVKSIFEIAKALNVEPKVFFEF